MRVDTTHDDGYAAKRGPQYFPAFVGLSATATEGLTMNKLLIPVVALLLGGCSIATSVSVTDDGNFSSDFTISMTKSELTTPLWTEMLAQINDPTAVSQLPTGATCSDTSDAVTHKYGCVITGNLNDPQFDTMLTSDSLGLAITRVGRTVTVNMAPPSGDTDSGLGLTSMTVTGKVKLPGTLITPLASCATAGTDAGSVNLSISGTSPCAVTYELDKDVGADTTTLLNASLSKDLKKVTLTATPKSLSSSAAAGSVNFYNGDKLLGTAAAENGTATLTKPIQPGTHALRAVFIPGNFWRYNQSQASSNVTVLGFTITKAPAVSGQAKVGATLTAAPGTWSPKPSSISYQWLRNGKAIAGATGVRYKTTATDKGKAIGIGM